MIKAIAILTLWSFSFGFSNFPACREQQKKGDNSTVDNPVDVKVLAEGSHSAISDPFVAVLRDDETYTKLREKEPALPQLAPDFFQSNVVVAAFLGTRNTGGYSVAITREANGKIRVTEKAPAKGAMTTQVLTSPYKLVSFASNGAIAAELSVDATLRERAQLYRIGSGTFKLAGGFTGRQETFQLTGKLQLTRLGNLVTIGFAIVSRGSERERSLRGAATGFISKDGDLVINRMSHGSLVDPPSGELKISGKFVEQNKLTLDVSSIPLNVPESYSGSGTIEAELVSASAN